MASIQKVMISSTARDLPEHRKQVMDACQAARDQPSKICEIVDEGGGAW